MTESMIENGPRPVPPNVPIPKYCAFIDVLGYGELIKDETLDYSKKSLRLSSLYSNAITSIGLSVGHLNDTYGGQIKAWSFSDSLYLQCEHIDMLVVAISRIFNDTFNLYGGFTIDEEWTPLLRCGIAKGWTHEFPSFSSMVNKRKETTPVGPGVAHAYWTAEKSGLSGMKIILTEEVILDLQATHVGSEPIDRVSKEITSEGVVMPYFFKRVTGGTKEKPVTLFEQLWAYDTMSNMPWNYIDELLKLRTTFKPKYLRHYVDTARLLCDSMDISGLKDHMPEVYERDRKRLIEMITEGSAASVPPLEII